MTIKECVECISKNLPYNNILLAIVIGGHLAPKNNAKNAHPHVSVHVSVSVCVRVCACVRACVHVCVK